MLKHIELEEASRLIGVIEKSKFNLFIVGALTLTFAVCMIICYVAQSDSKYINEEDDDRFVEKDKVKNIGILKALHITFMGCIVGCGLIFMYIRSDINKIEKELREKYVEVTIFKEADFDYEEAIAGKKLEHVELNGKPEKIGDTLINDNCLVKYVGYFDGYENGLVSEYIVIEF